LRLLDWVKSLVSQRGKAIALYRSGMEKAKKGDFRGAISDYTAALQVPGIPDDVKGMALYNRAISRSSINEHESAAEDLASLLKVPHLPENVRVQAHQRRERLRRRSEGKSKP